MAVFFLGLDKVRAGFIIVNSNYINIVIVKNELIHYD